MINLLDAVITAEDFPYLESMLKAEFDKWPDNNYFMRYSDSFCHQILWRILHSSPEFWLQNLQDVIEKIPEHLNHSQYVIFLIHVMSGINILLPVYKKCCYCQACRQSGKIQNIPGIQAIIRIQNVRIHKFVGTDIPQFFSIGSDL